MPCLLRQSHRQLEYSDREVDGGERVWRVDLSSGRLGRDGCVVDRARAGVVERMWSWSVVGCQVCHARMQCSAECCRGFRSVSPSVPVIGAAHGAGGRTGLGENHHHQSTLCSLLQHHTQSTRIALLGPAPGLGPKTAAGQSSQFRPVRQTRRVVRSSSRSGGTR